MFNGEGQNFIKMHYYVQIMTLLYLHIQPLSGKGFQQDAKRKEDPVHVVPSRLPFHHKTRRSRLIRNLLKDGSNRISQSVISWRGSLFINDPWMYLDNGRPVEWVVVAWSEGSWDEKWRVLSSNQCR